MGLSDGLNPTGLLKRALNANLANLFRRESGFLVLDIGSSSVKLAEVHHTGEVPTLASLAMRPIPSTCIQSNVIQDEGPVVDAIRALVASTGAQAKRVITAIPGPAVIVKKVILPAADLGPAVEAAVLAEAGHLIPESLDNVNLDYQVTDWIETGNKMEVLVVAVKKEIINSYVETIRAAGLDPVLVDVDYFALENMYELSYDAPDGRPVALVNIGARYSSINILKDGRSTFTGDVPVGGAEFNDALARQLGLSPEDAEAIKRGGKPKGVDPTAVEPVMASVTEFIVEEIQRALSFFWTAATDEPLGGVVLSGGTARAAGLVAQLKQRLECPVETADPFRRISIGSRVDRSLIEAAGPALAVMVGLATRRPGDK
ncbi:MAG: type IV pilus assembly protein PilM [Acidimicrobiales bacterium]